MRDPFKIDEPTCISFSGGRTSAYMLHRVLESNGGLPGEAVVCFANTGKECEETLEFVRDCGKHWSVPIVWLEYRADGFAVVDFESASRNGEPFEALIAKRKYLPNPVARFCTSELKILTIDRYMKSVDLVDYETMVGLRADESRRVAKLRDSKLTPLVDAGVDKRQVLAFWSAQPFDLRLRHDDGVTVLGNCDLCFLKGAKQIASIIEREPHRAVWWAKQEALRGASFRSDRPSYKAMLDYTKTQMPMFNADETLACFCGD